MGGGGGGTCRQGYQMQVTLPVPECSSRTWTAIIARCPVEKIVPTVLVEGSESGQAELKRRDAKTRWRPYSPSRKGQTQRPPSATAHRGQPPREAARGAAGLRACFAAWGPGGPSCRR